MSEPDEVRSNGDDSPRVLPAVSRRRAALINTAFGYLSVVFTIIQGVLLVPLYVRHIPVTLYGAWLATGNVLAWLELVDPGMGVVIQQRLAFAYGAKRTDDIARIIGTSLAIAALLSLVPLLLFPASHHLGAWLRVTAAEGDVLGSSFRVGLVSTCVSLAAFSLHAVSTGLQLTLFTGFVAVGSSFVGLVVTFVMLLRGVGLISLPIGMLVRSTLLFLGNAVQIALWSKKFLPTGPVISRSEARAFGGLLGLTFNIRLGSVLLERMEAFLTARLISPTAAARLVLTGRAAEVVRTIGSRVAPALSPSLAHLAGEGKHARVAEIFGLLGRYQGWLTAIGVAGVIALNEMFVMLWVGPAFFGGQTLTLLQGLATGLALMTGAAYQVIIASGRIRAVSLLALADAAVRLPLQIFLAKRIGIVGLPLATCISSGLVSGTYLLWLTRKMYESETLRPSRDWIAALGWITALSVVASLLHLVLAGASLRWTWLRLVVASCIVGVLLSAAVLAIEPRARELLRQAIAWRRSRAAPLDPP